MSCAFDSSAMCSCSTTLAVLVASMSPPWAAAVVAPAVDAPAVDAPVAEAPVSNFLFENFVGRFLIRREAVFCNRNPQFQARRRVALLCLLGVSPALESFVANFGRGGNGESVVDDSWLMSAGNEWQLPGGAHCPRPVGAIRVSGGDGGGEHGESDCLHF